MEAENHQGTGRARREDCQERNETRRVEVGEAAAQSHSRSYGAENASANRAWGPIAVPLPHGREAALLEQDTIERGHKNRSAAG